MGMEAIPTLLPKASGIAYSYVRFSTSEQIKGDSLRRQTEASEEYALEHGLTIDRTLKLQDLGISAFRGRNAVEGTLAGFLAMVKNGRVAPGSQLLVESLDRLSRDEVSVAMAQFLLIINSGITIVTLLDKEIYSRESIKKNPGSLYVSLGVMMRAHNESDDKSKRVAKAWGEKRRKAREEGAPLSGNCPGWLRKTTVSYEIIPERATIVRRIFQLAADGPGKGVIAQMLNEEGILTWGGKSWYESHIGKLLANPAVLGTFQPRRRDPETNRYIPDGDPISNYFPAIITPQEWQAVQGRPHAPRGPRFRRIGNLFSGLVYCGYTAYKMRFASRGRNSYLRSDIERFDRKAKPQTWPYTHFERTVLQHLRYFDWDSLIGKAHDPERDRLQSEEARVNLAIADKEQAINRILDEFVASQQPSKLALMAHERALEIAAEVEKLQSRGKEIRGRLSKIAEQAEAASNDSVEKFKRLIATASPQDRRKLQTQIRYRVGRIYCYRCGMINEDGMILNVAPAIEIEYNFGLSSVIWIGTDNPVRNPRARQKL